MSSSDFSSSPLLITADRLEQISTVVREWDGGHLYADDANDLDLSIKACRLVHQLAQMDPWIADYHTYDPSDPQVACVCCEARCSPDTVSEEHAHFAECLWLLARQLDQGETPGA